MGKWAILAVCKCAGCARDREIEYGVLRFQAKNTLCIDIDATTLLILQQTTSLYL